MGMVKENHDKLFKAKLKINVVQTYGQLFFLIIMQIQFIWTRKKCWNAWVFL